MISPVKTHMFQIHMQISYVHEDPHDVWKN